MRKLIILVFVIFISDIAYGQQFPLQSQYQFNYSIINPSVVVENDFTSVRTSFRQQWVGFSDNPIATQNLSVYRGFGKNGLGFNAFNDETGGAFNTSGLSLSYAHKVIFTDYEVYLGVSGGFSKVNISDISDPAIINNEDILPDVSFGAYLKYDKLRIGISVPGLLNENMELTSSINNTVKSNIYTMVSYSHQLNELVSLHPSFLLKTTENKSQLDANLNMKIKNKIWVGASYRQDFGPSLFVGIDFGKLFSIPFFRYVSMSAYSPNVISSSFGWKPYSISFTLIIFFNLLLVSSCILAILCNILAMSFMPNSFTSFLGISDNTLIVFIASSLLVSFFLLINLTHLSSVTSFQLFIIV